MPGAAKFSPGVIDYDGRMSASYQAGRALSAEAASTWCATVAPFVRAAPCARVLDLGSGTGRFATLFARSFETGHAVLTTPLLPGFALALEQLFA